MSPCFAYAILLELRWQINVRRSISRPCEYRYYTINKYHLSSLHSKLNRPTSQSSSSFDISIVNMQYLTILALATAAFAAPLEERQAGLCSSGSPLCCATDILNLAILDCGTRTCLPKDLFITDIGVNNLY